MVSSVWMKIQFCQQMRWVADDLSTNWHNIDVCFFLGTGEPRHWYFIDKMRWDGHIPKTQGHQNTIIRHLESRISITELITKRLKYRDQFTVAVSLNTNRKTASFIFQTAFCSYIAHMQFAELPIWNGNVKSSTANRSFVEDTSLYLHTYITHLVW